MSLTLYLLVAAGVLFWAAKLDRGPSGRGGLVLVAVPLVVTGRAMVGGRVFAPIDLAWQREPLASMREAVGVAVESPRILHDLWSQMIPWHAAVRRAFSEGFLPLWNPFVMGGEPLLAAYQPGILHPIRLLGLLLPLPDALTWMATATNFLAAISMYLLARELGAREDSALLPAIAWCYASYLQFWLQWAHGLAAAGAPLAILATLRVIRCAEGAPSRLLAFAVALLLLAGSPEAALISGLMVIGIGLAVLPSVGPGWRAAVVGRCAGGWVLGLLLAAAQLLPFLEALPQTAEWRTRSLGAVHAASPIGEPHLLPAAGDDVDPQVDAAEGAGSPRRDRLKPVASWIGTLALGLAVFGAWVAKARLRIPLVCCLGLSFLYAMGTSPVAGVAAELPIVSLMLPRYGWLVFQLSLVCLASLGIEAASEARWGEARSKILVGCLLLPGPLLAGLWPQAVAYLPAPGGSWIRLVGFAAVGAGAAAAVVSVEQRKIRLLVWIVLLVAERMAVPFVRQESFDREWFFPEPAVVQTIRGELGESRVVALGNVLYPNLAAMWGIEDVRGYDPMQLRRLVETHPEWAWPKGSDSQFARVDALSAMLSYWNVEWAVSSAAVAAEGWEPAARVGPLFVARNRDRLPRAFVPEVVELDDGSDRWRELLKDRQAFARKTWLESAQERKLGATGSTRANGPCDLRQIEGGFRYRFEASCTRESWIATSIPAWRGWRASTRAGELEVGIVNHAFVGIRVPAGVSLIDLTFLPRSVIAGAALSVGALMLIAGASLSRRLRASAS